MLEHLVDEQNLASTTAELTGKVGKAPPLEVEIVHIDIETTRVVGSKVLLGILQEKSGFANTTGAFDAYEPMAPVYLIHQRAPNGSVGMLYKICVSAEECIHQQMVFESSLNFCKVTTYFLLLQTALYNFSFFVF